jgi:hypothetical protein
VLQDYERNLLVVIKDGVSYKDIPAILALITPYCTHLLKARCEPSSDDSLHEKRGGPESLMKSVRSL